MAINFPLSPSLGQLYTFAGSTWEWSGEYWEVYSGISSSVVYSITTDTGLSADTITGNVTLLNTLPNYAGGVLTNYSGWTNNGNGTMNLPSVQVALYDNTNFLEPLRVYTVASGVTGSGGISGLTDNDTNYIYIEYNNGSPRWVVSTDNSAINGSTVVRFQNVYRIGNFIHNLEWGNEGAGLPNKIANRIDAVDRFARESGLSLGLSGSTGVVTLSAGVAWNGTLRQSLASVNSQDDIFFQNFHSGGTWVISTTADTLNNIYYDNGTDRVVASAGTYLVNWYYRGQEINDHLYEVWGNSAYTSVANAQLSLQPELPELITSHAFLLGRIIVQKNALTGFVETAFVTPFQSTTVQNHNDLTGLQGGSAGQYYHLDANQYNNIALTNTNNNFSTNQTINGDLSVTGNTILNNITANTISATTISGGTFYGDGSNLIGVPKYYKEPSIPPITSPLVIGTDSIAIGNGAKTSGDNQLSFGTEAGQLSISGEGSTFIGWGAGYNSTGVTYSNLIGYFVGERVKNVELSNIIGEGAGIDGNNIYASNLIGLAAGTNATNISHSNFIGSNAGYNSSSSLSNFIGSRAGYSFTGGNNNIIIGNNISLPNNVSNSINIGGVLFGVDTYSTSGGTPSVVPTTQGKIGIGIVTPLNRLHVEDTSNPVRFVGLQSNSTDNRILSSDSNGIVRYRNFSDFTGGTSNVSGDYLPLSGGTVTGGTIFQSGLTGNTITATTISGGTFFGNGSGLTNVVLSVSASTGLSGNSTTGNITLINTAPDQTVTVTGGTNIQIAGSYPNFGVNFTGQTSFPYLPLSGGTVTGGTIFQSGLTANTISATTMSGGTFIGNGSGLTNVVLSVSASTGLSGNSTTGDITLINTAPDQTVTVTGGTNIQISGSYPNFGVNYTGQTSFPYLPLSGGTVSGDTIFQSGLTATTISATTISGGTFFGNGYSLSGVPKFYAEYVIPPLTSPTAAGLNSIAIGNGAQANTLWMFVAGENAGQFSNNVGASVFIGKEAGFNASDSAQSVNIGPSAGQNANLSPGATFIGQNAGRQASGATGSTFIGVNAGFGANSDYSVMVGYKAGESFTGNEVGSNNIIIGKNITLPNASFDSINIGGVLFGIGTYNATLGNPSLSPSSTGKIGIGVVSPLNRLHVTDTSDPIRLDGLQTLNTDTEVLTTDANGVLHKRTYDYVTGFTYASSSNTFTIKTSSGNTFNALINEMTGLTINGDLNVTGNYFVSGDTIVSGNTVFTGTTTYNTVPNAIGDFLTLPTSNVMSRRTAHQVRDDISYYGLTFAITNGYY